MAPRLITIVEAAEYLGVTERTMRNLVYRRELAHVKVGRATRFDLRELDRYIGAQTIEAAS